MAHVLDVEFSLRGSFNPSHAPVKQSGPNSSMKVFSVLWDVTGQVRFCSVIACISRNLLSHASIMSNTLFDNAWRAAVAPLVFFNHYMNFLTLH